VRSRCLRLSGLGLGSSRNFEVRETRRASFKLQPDFHCNDCSNMKVSCFSSQSLRGCIHRSRGLTPQSNKHFLSPIYDSAPRRFYRPSCLACQDASSYRQNLKLEERRRKEGLELNPGVKQARPTRPGNDWELSVGIEIHAELDTERKLFSSATTCPDASPNSNVALFDLAYPGSQPVFQVATLLPAIRAALALNCEIQPRSSFDRKHYLYPDQPAGYQITQFYRT
jgi:aspartyl-tRNA(Asn)/glutamyl-tRNA(Gln) amidotransferase subunit B